MLHSIGRSALKTAQKLPLFKIGAIAGATATLTTVAMASGDQLVPPELDWPHNGFLSTFDHASLRRGYEVYRQVCSTCHSMKFLAFRNLIGVTHTEEQVKMIAKTYDITDGPNDSGDMFERPGKPSDKFPKPYPNDETARFANNGALPPDLSCIVKARPGKEDYIFALLTGYREPPAGVALRPGLHYNPYFPGGAIGMTPPLNDGQIDYEDGTPASRSQLAKDVTAFLAWCSEPETDERKRAGAKFLTITVGAFFLAAYWKRFRWSIHKTRRITWIK